MPRWSGKSEFTGLSKELFASAGKDFERKVLSLLQPLWPDVVRTSPRRRLDRSGIDMLIWDKSPYILVIQCKAFEVSEEELGAPQKRQCVDSIESFRKSGIKAARYLLIHNREDRHGVIRAKVNPLLKQLITSGQVQDADLWERRWLLRQAFDAMNKKLIEAIPQANTRYYSEYWKVEAPLCDPLEVVPAKRSTCVVDQYRLLSSKLEEDEILDPAHEMARLEVGAKCVLLGEAGYGKTTTSLRLLSSKGRRVLYLPAARIVDKTAGARDLLEQYIDIDTLLQDYEVDHHQILIHLIRPVAEFLLKSEEYPVCLLIDGLDESQWLAKRGRLQWLMNGLRDIRVPVILTTRTEFWRSKLSDFTTSFGIASKKDNKNIKKQQIRQIELLPWTDDQIQRLARRYGAILTDEQQRRNIGQFIDLVVSGEYLTYYGDIPRRPLFLRFILESVAEQGLQKEHRTSLFMRWARMKITRDLKNTTIHANQRRIGIVDNEEGLDTTVELAFVAMQRAATLMISNSGGRMELLPSCSMEDILDSDRRLRSINDPTGLVLNSLLVPLEGEVPEGMERRVRFGHRVYQEVFLARHLCRCGETSDLGEPPEEVREWMTSFRSERLA